MTDELLTPPTDEPRQELLAREIMAVKNRGLFQPGAAKSWVQAVLNAHNGNPLWWDKPHRVVTEWESRLRGVDRVELWDTVDSMFRLPPDLRTGRLGWDFYMTDADGTIQMTIHDYLCEEGLRFSDTICGAVVGVKVYSDAYTAILREHVERAKGRPGERVVPKLHRMLKKVAGSVADWDAPPGQSSACSADFVLEAIGHTQESLVKYGSRLGELWARCQPTRGTASLHSAPNYFLRLGHLGEGGSCYEDGHEQQLAKTVLGCVQGSFVFTMRDSKHKDRYSPTARAWGVTLEHGCAFLTNAYNLEMRRLEEPARVALAKLWGCPKEEVLVRDPRGFVDDPKTGRWRRGFQRLSNRMYMNGDIILLSWDSGEEDQYIFDFNEALVSGCRAWDELSLYPLHGCGSDEEDGDPDEEDMW